MRRNTQEELIAMKKNILDACISRQMKCKDGAKNLSMHEKSFSRLKSNYLKYGEAILVPKKSGPKPDNPPQNKTPEYIENIVCELARRKTNAGTVDLADDLLDYYGIKIDQSTVYRILKRKKIRYCQEYVKIEKREPKLYCLEKPGLEVQLDACYPFGRGRKLVCFDAIDDCSRWAVSNLYTYDNANCAIEFVKYLVKRTPFQIQRIKVDNRYGHRFKEYCQSIEIEVITIDAYEPHQNGKVERYHKTLKNEFFRKYIGFYTNTELIKYQLIGWLNYYNNQRKHRGYGMNRLTPRLKIVASLFNSLCIIPEKKVTLTLQSYNTCQKFIFTL
jgi:transposase